MSQQLKRCPRQLYIINRRKAVFGHGKDVFGFIRKNDAIRICDLLSERQIDIFHCRDIVPYRHDLIFKSKLEQTCEIELINRNDYVERILENRMSIRVVIETKDIIEETISLISSMKIEPLYDENNQEFLEKLFKR